MAPVRMLDRPFFPTPTRPTRPTYPTRPTWPTRPTRRAPGRLRCRALPLFGFARANFGDALRVRHLEALFRARLIIEIRHGHARQPLVDGAFDGANARLIFRRYKRKRRTGQFCTSRPSDAMDVVLWNGGHVEINHVS